MSFWRGYLLIALGISLSCPVRLLAETRAGQANIPGQDQDPQINISDLQSFELSAELLVERVRKSGYRFSCVINDEETVTVALNLAHYRAPSDWEKWAATGPAPLADATIAVPIRPSVELTGVGYSTNFSADVRLKPGLSVFIVQATDERTKAVVRRDYHVFYVPPFYGRRWFLLSLASLGGAVALTMIVRGRRRRTALFKRRFNPYIAGIPVRDENLFFGRERLLESILQTVHNNSILLFGERRIGKTSVQHHLKLRLGQLKDSKYAFYPVFIDLQGTPQERFFATLRDEIRHELGPLIGEDLRSGTATRGPGYDYREFVEDLRAVLKALSARTDKKVKLVLLIDEIDQLNSYDPGINQRLRSLFMRNFAENLAAVVSGVAIRKHWEGEGSPWYNFFEEIEVKPFQKKDAEDLIRKPIRGVIRLERGVTDRIIALTGCKPYLIQKMCVSLVNGMYEKKKRSIGVADVEALAAADQP